MGGAQSKDRGGGCGKVEAVTSGEHPERTLCCFRSGALVFAVARTRTERAITSTIKITMTSGAAS